MTVSITRRQFLKAAGAAGAVTVITGCTANLQQTEYLETYVTAPEEGLPGEDLWYASTCRQCAAGCGIIVRVSEGRARKIEGNPQHPLNQGRLCARGQAGLQALYHPDRLRNALRQKGGRGSREFEPMYWDDAVLSVGAHLESVSDPSRIAFLAGGGTSDHLFHLAQRFMNALGAPPPLLYDLHSELEGRQVLHAAQNTLFGSSTLPLYDISGADVVFSFAANFLETWLSPVQYSAAFGRLRQGQAGKRGYIVQFESRLSNTAANADKWVSIKPGTEGLVALALGRIIIDEGLGHEISHRGHAVLYKNVSVGEIATASGVSAENLRRLARIFADADHQIALPGGGLSGIGDGITSVTAVQALNVIMGRLGVHGGLFLPGSAPGEGFVSPPRSTYADMLELISRMRAGDVQILFIHGANPLFELPRAADFASALAEVPLVVSFASLLDETAAQADYILPDHSYLEGWGYQVVSPPSDRPVISGQQPVVRPLYDTRATADVLLALAQTMEGDVATALPWPNEVEYLKSVVTQLRDTGTSPITFWTRWRQQGGWWPQGQDVHGPSAGSVFQAPLAQPRVEFTGDVTQYPYLLHLYPSLTLSDGRGASLPWLQETPDPMTTVAWNTWIEINPQTAERLGVGNDDVVRITSPAGEVEASVYIYPGIPPDMVAMPIGQGHTEAGRYSTGLGVNPIDLLPGEADPETGSLKWATTRVQIASTGRRKILARLESIVGVEHARENGAPG